MSVHTRRVRLLDERLGRLLSKGLEQASGETVRGCVDEMRQLLLQEKELMEQQQALLHEGRTKAAAAELQLERAKVSDLELRSLVPPAAAPTLPPACAAALPSSH